MNETFDPRKVVEDNFSLYRSLYSGRYRGASFEVLNKARITLSLLRRASLAGSSPRILDVGFGWGTCLSLMAAGGMRVYGVEPVQAAARSAGQRLPSARLTVGEAADLPFQDGSFNAIVCSHVLEHLPDDRQAVAELVRVLRPGGWVVVGVPGPGIGPHPLHFRTYDLATLAEALRPLRPVHALRRGGRLFKAVSRLYEASNQRQGSTRDQASTSSSGRIATAARSLAFWSLARLAPFDDWLAARDTKPEEVWLLARRDPLPNPAPAEVDIMCDISKSC